MAWEHIDVALKRMRGFTSQALMTWLLPVIALLLVHEGQKERAVELLALAFTHPLSPTGWMEQWPLLTEVRAELEAELGAEIYQSAWERGKALDVGMVMAALLSSD